MSEQDQNQSDLPPVAYNPFEAALKAVGHEMLGGFEENPDQDQPVDHESLQAPETEPAVESGAEVKEEGTEKPAAEGDDYELSDGTRVTLEELKNGYFRQSDYTRKTTDLAREREETARSMSDYRERAQALSNAYDTAERFLTDLIPPEPAATLAGSDPQKFATETALRQQALAHLRQVVEARRQVAAEMQAKDAENARMATEAENRRLVEAMPDLREPAKMAEFNAGVKEAAASFGFTEQDLSQVADHRIFRVLHFANLGLKAEENRKAVAVKAVPEPRRESAPSARAGVNSRNQGNSDAMRRFTRTGKLNDATMVNFDF